MLLLQMVHLASRSSYKQPVTGCLGDVWHRETQGLQSWIKGCLGIQSFCSSCFMLTSLSLSLSSPCAVTAGRSVPAGSWDLGHRGSHGISGDSGCQPPALHGSLHHAGHGGNALPAGLPRLLRRHPREQMPPALCKCPHHSALGLCLLSEHGHGWRRDGLIGVQRVCFFLPADLTSVESGTVL